ARCGDCRSSGLELCASRAQGTEVSATCLRSGSFRLFAGADSTHVLDLVIRNTERMVVLPPSPLYMECSERELSFAILDVAAALSRPDLAIAMRPLSTNC